MSLLSRNINKIKPSPTVAMLTRAKEMKAQGIDVLSLSVGEPDFDTPENIKEAARKAIREGKTKYTPVDGITELKKAIINKYASRIKADEDNVIISSGAKQSLYNCFISTLEEDDEVIIPIPYWVSYPDMVKLAGGKPVYINCPEEQNFKLTPDSLESAISERSKLLILNTPNNPTGAKYSREELKSLATIISKYPQLNVIADDIYESIIFDNDCCSLIDIAPELKNQICIVNGVSKAYAMTGWRIGYAIGGKELVKAMKKVQSQSTSNPCSISQYASIEALSGNQDFIAKTTEIYKKRRDLSCGLLNNIKGISCAIPDGTFYTFPNCQSFINKKTPDGTIIKNSYDFCEFLIEKARVLLVPGSAFGIDGYFRFSFATSEENIKEGIKRIAEACDLLAE